MFMPLYIDYRSTYDQLLAHDSSYRIHHQNLQRLAIEIYKFKHNLGPEILNEIFQTLIILGVTKL